jgi:hypothetical protein
VSPASPIQAELQPPTLTLTDTVLPPDLVLTPLPPPTTQPSEGAIRLPDTTIATDIPHATPILPPTTEPVLPQPVQLNLRNTPTTHFTAPQKIHLCTYNIVSGRGSRLIAAVRAMAVMHVDIALFTKSKLNDDIYPRSYMGYNIIATPAPSQHQGGVALAWREGSGYTVESITIHDANLISFQLVSSGYRWLIAALYLIPNSPATTVCNKIIQLRNKHTNLPLIVTGDMNINLDNHIFN